MHCRCSANVVCEFAWGVCTCVGVLDVHVCVVCDVYMCGVLCVYACVGVCACVWFVIVCRRVCVRGVCSYLPN